MVERLCVGNVVQPLADWIAVETRQDVPAAARAASDAIVTRHGPHVLATIFYGSCLRPPSADPTAVAAGGESERVLDFFVVVDRLESIGGSRVLDLANWLLPPNVYYIETSCDGRTVRCKYGILSLAQLERLTRASTWQNYFWGRLSQPTAIVFEKSIDARRRIEASMVNACRTMLYASLPLMRGPFDARQLWIAALTESYRAELRAETPETRARQIFDADSARYSRIVASVEVDRVEGIRAEGTGKWSGSGRGAAAARRAWLLRRVVGKTLNALRIVKAAFTFANGIDYLVWKIERHSGVRLPIGPWERHHPVLCAPILALRAWRLGAFR